MRPTWLTYDILWLLAQGLQVTLLLTLITSVLAMGIGIGIGTLRLSSSGPSRFAGSVFVEVHRNVPALVLILFWAFAIPNLFPPSTRQQLFFDNRLVNALSDLTGLPLIYYAIAAVLALSLNTGAYIAELFRAGVGTIPQEQMDTARTLGASTWQVYGRILLVQGLQRAMPAIATRLIHNMKNTSLAAFVSVPELFHSTQTSITRSFRAIEFLLVTAAIYLTLSILMSHSLSRWMRHG